MTRREKILGLANELENELTEAINNEEWDNDNEKHSMLNTLTSLADLGDDIKDVFFEQSKREKMSGDPLKGQYIPKNEYNKQG